MITIEIPDYPGLLIAIGIFIFFVAYQAWRWITGLWN